MTDSLRIRLQGGCEYGYALDLEAIQIAGMVLVTVDQRSYLRRGVATNFEATVDAAAFAEFVGALVTMAEAFTNSSTLGSSNELLVELDVTLGQRRIARTFTECPLQEWSTFTKLPSMWVGEAIYPMSAVIRAFVEHAASRAEKDPTDPWSWPDTLVTREFWSLYYQTNIGGPSTDLVFGVKWMSKPFVELRKELLEKVPQRALRLSFPDSYVWEIEFGRQGVYHSILHPTMSAKLLVGSDDGHPTLPILRFREALALTDACRGSDVPPGFLPLLLYRLVGFEAEEIGEANQRIRADWRATKLLDTPHLEEFMKICGVGPATKWRCDDRFGFVNDADGSYRNPDGDMYGKAWRKLAESMQAEGKTKESKRYLRQANELAAKGWKADVEFARLRAFFDAVGAG